MSTTRVQPWKTFADPDSQQFTKLISEAPTQTLFNVGDAALTQYASENAAGAPLDSRHQPWKAFADPNSEQLKQRIIEAPDQKLFNVGDAALMQYALENK